MRIGGVVGFLLFFSWCNIVEASPLRLSVGTSIIKADIQDPKYKYINQNEIVPSFNVGLIKSFDPLVISLQTNKLFNHTSTRSVINTAGVTFQNKSKISIDTLGLGLRINRFIPGIFFSNTKLEKSLWYKGNFQGKQINNTILYGANLAYILTKNTNLNLFIAASNKELFLKSAVGMGINLIF